MIRSHLKALMLVSWLGLPALCGSDLGALETAGQVLHPESPDSVIRIGILSHRPLDEASHYWQSLRLALEEALPGLRVELVLKGFAGIDAQVEADQIDLVLTNPNHYIQLRARKPGMRAVATMIEEVQGQLLPMFGGVIAVRADRSDLAELADLDGVRIGAVDPQSLGGYRAQLFELQQQGLPLPDLSRVRFTDMPHDQVVDAVLNAEVDAGFVRTGILEDMAAAGTIDLSEIRILNAQDIPGFPLALSTRLYPQWALAAMPGLSVTQANRITAALLTLDFQQEAAASSIGLRFTVAVDYSAVDDLARALRLPPYEEIPRVSVREFVVSHPRISAGIAILIFVLMGLSVLLWFARARIKQTAGALQRLVASVQVGLTEARVGADGEPELLYLSDRGKELIDLPAGGKGASVKDFVRNMHPDDLDLFMQANREAIADSAPLDIDVRFKVNGQWRWLQVASNPLRRPDGVLVWSGSIMDVTELRQTSARFEAIFEQSPVAILIHDPKTGEILDANPQAWHEYRCADRDEFLAKQDMIWSRESPYTLEEAVLRLGQVAHGKQIQFDWPLQRADGSTIWHRVTLAPIRYAEQEQVIALCLDITEQRLAEKRLRESEARFRTLLDDIDEVAVQGYRLDGSVHYWNRAAEKLYGYTREEALGSNLLDLIIPQEMRPAVRENMAQVARGGGIDNGELELVDKNGRRISVYSSHTVLRPPGQEPELFCLDIDLSERKQHEQELLTATNYDGLTGLPNRTLLGELMTQACARADRNGSALALCYLDLDQFKSINDAHGMDLGDQVLVGVARRLRRLVRGSDVVARLGGDEFVLLLEGVAEQATLHERLQFLLEGVARPMRVNGMKVRAKASIGVTLYPQDANDPEALLRHASQAMFEAKRKGRHRFSLFDPQLEQDLEQRRQMLVEIENGLADKQFVLFYQPKVDMASGCLIGLEALVRWQHPSRGLLPPAAFLDYLDGTELERVFGQYVIVTTLAQLAAWNEVGLDWTVSVNIAGPHLLGETFVDDLLALLGRFPSVRPEQLELEILESAAVGELDRAVLTLKRCRELGMSVALDDFGTGYSSLSRLRSLPVDVLKIDQSFVRDMLADLSSYSIVKSVIGLGHAFGLDVIAEGVETTDHAVTLLQLGCRQGQGYGFARPMPADAVVGWFEQWRKSALWRQLELRRVSAAESTLDIAVQTHLTWLNRVRQALQDGAAEQVTDAADHDHCALGLWLRDEGRHLFGQKAEFLDLVAKHRDVHRLAGEAAEALVAGSRSRPGLEERLERASIELKETLQALRGRYLGGTDSGL